QPYDRVSPHAAIVAQRMTALSRLARLKGREKPSVLLTTVNAVAQRVPARMLVEKQSLSAAPGNRLDMESIIGWLELNGYLRASTVREPGDYAVRGGILDLFPPGMDEPVRFDFFGDTLESIRSFDPETQRTRSQLRGLDLVPVAEFQLTTETIRKFRTSYVEAFGAPTPADTLYHTVSEGRRSPGMEHWLPLFHDRLDTLFDYLPDTPVVLEHLAADALAERFRQIADYYEARKNPLDGGAGGTPYHPLPPDRLYLTEDEWSGILGKRRAARLSPFSEPESDGAVIDIGIRQGRNFAPERAAGGNVFEAVAAYVADLQQQRRKVTIALWSDGSRERMRHVLVDHRLVNLNDIGAWRERQAMPRPEIALAVVGIESGFETDEMAVLTEQDILGDRLVRTRRASRKAENFIAEVTSLSTGDLVVHVDHGIGRFVGLQAIEVSGAPHDCLEIRYAGDTKLYLPVENIELLSRYGSEDMEVELDRLGGSGWQTRKAKMKNRIREIAGELIKIAAERQLREAPRFEIGHGAYDEFAAGFPHQETEDQQAAIDATLDDLAAGRPMDRLICGDVGFGKTEVALRAAAAAVLCGHQVAVLAPTTVLVRQHLETFRRRFAALGTRIELLSRLSSPAEARATKAGLASGEIGIAIGTQALAAKDVRFKRLGLVIIDEEQRFGARQKAMLRRLGQDVHCLTLTATPIPRTLQSALIGLQALSIIVTPPARRQPIRTLQAVWTDSLVKETLLREQRRGGQSFIVCPRIADIAPMRARIRRLLPRLKLIEAHGDMPAEEIDAAMVHFADGGADALLSTNIVETGLDVPRANTMLVWRAELFGLTQLHQLRGRVGRSRARGNILLLTDPEEPPSAAATRRLNTLQAFDRIGAGFAISARDMDLRGAGDLLGEEQAGHVKLIGIGLYQHLLEGALRAARGEAEQAEWTPQVKLGISAAIPEDYIAEDALRVELHARMGEVSRKGDAAALEELAEEIEDRFGAPPPPVRHWLDLARLRLRCRHLGVRRLEVGPQGAVAQLEGERLVLRQPSDTPAERLALATRLLANVRRHRRQAA
ncbi:MAG TPA: transcription-repair coupling factor, partial [Roseomonas sp.]|nr:transcription-repair coupling factor [Roseomonas sp.]